jgi:hypothetical protein
VVAVPRMERGNRSDQDLRVMEWNPMTESR